MKSLPNTLLSFFQLRLLPWGPGVIFGSFCLIVTLLFVLAPETNNRQLPQTVIEIEMWEKEKKSDDKIYKSRMTEKA